MLEHGGRLPGRSALRHPARRLARPVDRHQPAGLAGAPLPAPSGNACRKADDGLEAAAAAYYGNLNLLPVAGSQAAIQWLPALLPRRRRLHRAALCRASTPGSRPGTRSATCRTPRCRAPLAAATPILLCNPNNPTADRHPHELVLDAARQLHKRGGWLIVDEAFVADTGMRRHPLAGSTRGANLIVLRSLGKFFGWPASASASSCRPRLLRRMREAMGPWASSGPSRGRPPGTGRPRLAGCRPAATEAAGERLRHPARPARRRSPRPLSPRPRRAATNCSTHLARRAILTRRSTSSPCWNASACPQREAAAGALAVIAKTPMNEWQTAAFKAFLRPTAPPFRGNRPLDLAAHPLCLLSAAGESQPEGRHRPGNPPQAPARRIVALAPHRRNLYAGAGDKLVGTVDYSDHPPEAKKCPRRRLLRVDLKPSPP